MSFANTLNILPLNASGQEQIHWQVVLMTHILIADNIDGIANLEQILGKRHQFTLAPTMPSALAALEQKHLIS